MSDALAAALDKPAGTAEQHFMLMMHERIERLEAKADEQAAALLAHEAIFAAADVKGYNASTNSFTDHMHITWDPRDPLDDAHGTWTWRLDTPHLNPSHWDAVVVVVPWLYGSVELRMPVSKDGKLTRPMRLQVDTALTVRILLTRIREFYGAPITMDDLLDHDPSTCEYTFHAMESLRADERVTWRDVLGFGCVTYDGIRRVKNGGLLLKLILD